VGQMMRSSFLRDMPTHFLLSLYSSMSPCTYFSWYRSICSC
jgi:hypothetical protein